MMAHRGSDSAPSTANRPDAFRLGISTGSPGSPSRQREQLRTPPGAYSKGLSDVWSQHSHLATQAGRQTPGQGPQPSTTSTGAMQAGPSGLPPWDDGGISGRSGRGLPGRPGGERPSSRASPVHLSQPAPLRPLTQQQPQQQQMQQQQQPHQQPHQLLHSPSHNQHSRQAPQLGRSMSSSRAQRGRGPAASIELTEVIGGDFFAGSAPPASWGAGLSAPRPGSRGQRIDVTTNLHPIELDSTDNAAAFFRAAGQMLQSSPQAESPMAGAWARPPPAGMRGALSWGVGPNAYENDGRPGTRSGGIAYDLEGRPLTRSSIRPPSRLQLGLSGTVPPSPGALGAQQPALPGATYPGKAGLGATSSPPHTRGRAAAPSSGARSGAGSLDLDQGWSDAQSRGTPGRPGSQSMRRGGRTMVLSGPGPWPQSAQRQPSPYDQPLGRAVRDGHQHRGAAGGTGASGAAASAGAGQSSTAGPGARYGMASPGVFKVDEEGDVDAFLDALSGDEEECTNLEDLKTYLSTLDQDRQSIHGSGTDPGPHAPGQRRPGNRSAAQPQAPLQLQPGAKATGGQGSRGRQAGSPMSSAGPHYAGPGGLGAGISGASQSCHVAGVGGAAVAGGLPALAPTL